MTLPMILMLIVAGIAVVLGFVCMTAVLIEERSAKHKKDLFQEYGLRDKIRIDLIGSGREDDPSS